MIIEEKINFTNTRDVVEAIKNKTVGAKVDQSFAQNADKINFDNYFKKANENNIKNTTWGVQFLLGHTDINTYMQAINNDALYLYLTTKQKPWAKQLPIFIKFESSKFDQGLWQDFENEIMKQEQQHGKKRLTDENENEVKTLCKSGDWVLYMPLSYKGECAVAKDNAGNAGWCTRRENHYNTYTQNGKTHLYVLRNTKTKEAYQFAFMKDSVEIFNSVDGRETSYSSSYNSENPKLKKLLKELPDDILKNIKDENEKRGRSLLDFKVNVLKRSQKETYGEPEHVSGNIYKVRIFNYKNKDKTVNNYFSHKNLKEESYFGY